MMSSHLNAAIEHFSNQRNGSDAVDALIALTPSEIAEFFPTEQLTDIKRLLPDAAWFDPAETGSADWLEQLNVWRPKIMLTAWQTPRLPLHVPNLQYVCHLAGSVRGIVPRELLVSGLKVTNWGGIAAPMVAEHALLLILGALRSMPRWERFLAAPFSHADTVKLQTRTLRGQRVAIHGFGQIARELVRLLQPFGVEITSFSSGVPRSLMLDHGVRQAASLEELAADADVFVSCEALTDRTRGSIGRSVLSKLRRGSVFVNVGRGAIVDEQALVEVATEQKLRVASDVFINEPLPLDSPLRELPAALYSPHIGGPTVDCYPKCGSMAIENIDRYLRGETLLNQVSVEIFDRST
jgi:phosphoglycerate dehydrogenase-like enzyme